VRAIAGDGGALVLATANRVDCLSAELLARFRIGTLFFDLPTAEEQAGIWRIWREKYGISDSDKLPDCAGWVGREIASCCDLADRLGVPLREAAAYVVPVCRSSADVIEARRTGASGRYLSASVPGVYRYEKNALPSRTGRKVEA
jgi:SpoVK/Ycf46/Vps4 family AAA+-type ATPase